MSKNEQNSLVASTRERPGVLYDETAEQRKARIEKWAKMSPEEIAEEMAQREAEIRDQTRGATVVTAYEPNQQ